MASRNIGKLVFSSSGGTVYGEPIYVPLDESHPTNPKALYGVTKLAIEKYIYYCNREYGINASILRVSNPYGERQRVGSGQGAIGVFLHKALKGESIEIWGNGNIQRDYIYIEDVADAFVRALGYRGEKSILNISSSEGKTLNELLDLIEGILGRPIERNYLPQRNFDVGVNVLDNSLAKKELGWAPKVSLIDGINRNLNFIIHKNIQL
jgi:UDP-glucose 4-epimerase